MPRKNKNRNRQKKRNHNRQKKRNHGKMKHCRSSKIEAIDEEQYNVIGSTSVDDDRPVNTNTRFKAENSVEDEEEDVAETDSSDKAAIDLDDKAAVACVIQEMQDEYDTTIAANDQDSMPTGWFSCFPFVSNT